MASEDAIEPELPILDPQHHLYDRQSLRYLFFDFLADLNTGHNVVGTVTVEAAAMYRTDGPQEMRPLGETEFFNGAAAISASGRYGKAKIGAAIVGFADLRLGERVRPVLEAHVRAGGSRFRGIRMATSWHPTPSPEMLPLGQAHIKITPQILLNRRFREGFACLLDMGLSFDALVHHPQLPEIVDLAHEFPSAVIIVNHCGNPLGIGPFANYRAEVFEDWRDNIASLATCPNVVIKLGGLRRSGALDHLNSRITPKSADIAAAWRPFIEICIQAFGPKRCMFESNFPSDKAVCSYATLWNAFKIIARPYTREEKAELFIKTAARAYRLPEFQN